MAISASISYHDGFFGVFDDRDGSRPRVAASPPVPAGTELPPLSFLWATAELNRGELEFIGATIEDLDALDEAAFPSLSVLGLPRLGCPIAELFDVEVADVLRWAKRNCPGRAAVLARRQTALALLEQELVARGAEGLVWEYQNRSEGPLTRLELVFTAPGAPEPIRVTTEPLRYGFRSIPGDFPWSVPPQYEVDTTLQDHWFEEPWVQYFRGHDPAELARRICLWRDSYKPIPTVCGRPLATVDLARLRTRAGVIQQLVIAAQESADVGARNERWGTLGLQVDPHLVAGAAALTEDSQRSLQDDIAHIDGLRLMASFPRDERGRLPLGTDVLLVLYDSTQPQSQYRQKWLVARAPARRRDPQVVRLVLDSLIGVNHAHRWDEARWLWDERAVPADEATRWGVAGLDSDALGLEERDRQIRVLAQRCAAPTASLADRVALCLLLQDAGQVQEAFDLFGIELTREVQVVLAGRFLNHHDLQYTAAWAVRLLDELRWSAPWLMLDTAQRLGRRLRVHLFTLPTQHHPRKASLMLVAGKKRGDPPRLTIEYTASNKRLPDLCWRRPLDLDLRRFGLLDDAMASHVF